MTEVEPMELSKAIAKHGLSIRAEFVPFSRSRHKDAKLCDLNWNVTLVRNGRDILTTEYSAGQAHCPAYKLRKASPKQDSCWPLRFDQIKANAIALECETGRAHAIGFSGRIEAKKAAISPNDLDVIHCLISDSDAVSFYRGFEDWAETLGYDPDSRSAEAIYNACVKHGIALLAALGHEAMAEIQAAAAEY